MNKVKKSLNLILSVFLTLGFLGFIPGGMSAASAEPQSAFADLSRCLQSQGKSKVLDVFYLVDESASLQTTDPDAARARILSSSLLQLASFRKDVTVNYSVAFFAHSYGVWQSWRTVNQSGIVSEAARLDAEVRKRDKGQHTDWLQGINGAIKELDAQHARTNGCSTLIWLTDGGIELGSVKKTQDAVVDLCDNKFELLRKSKVTVLGVLLKNEDALNTLDPDVRKTQLSLMSLFTPLVEGSGTLSNGDDLKCGTNPVPKNYAQGAVFEAQDPKDLAYQFLSLTPQIEGCTQTSLLKSSNGGFEIERGISEFQVVTTAENWSLTDPKGKTYGQGSAGLEVFDTGGAYQIKYGTTNTGLGKWKFAGNGGQTSLYYCSGLDIRIDPGSEFIAGRAGILSGKVIDASSGLPADLSVYDSNHPITIEQIAGGRSGKSQGAEQSNPSNFLLQKFTPQAGSAESEVRITLYLTTKNGVKLAPLSVSQKIDVRLLGNYPTLKNEPVKLSELTLDNKVATGKAIFKGPQLADGKVCIDPNLKPIVLQDKYSRADTYQVKTSGVDVNGCMPIRSGEESSIQFDVSNEVTGESDIVLGVPVTYYSDAEPGKHFTLAANVNFHIAGPKGAWLWKVILTILGLLFPIGLIYLLNRFTTQMAFGRQLQNATYNNVQVQDNDRYLDANGAPLVTNGLDFKGNSQRNGLTIYESNGLTFKARASKWIFAEPWYEVVAPEGHRVITLVHKKPRLNKRFNSGRVAPIVEDLAKVWVLKISDDALRNFDKDKPVKGSLIIFMRNTAKDPQQFQTVFNNVTTKSGVWNEIRRLSEEVKKEKSSPEKPKRFGKKKETPSPKTTEIKPPTPPRTRPGDSGGVIRPGTTTSIRPSGNRPTGNSPAGGTISGSASNPGGTPKPPTDPNKPRRV